MLGFNIFSSFQSRLLAIGLRILSSILELGQGIILMLNALGQLIHAIKRRREIARQCFTVGIKSLGVTSIVAVFTGMILTLQTGLKLKNYGQEVNVGVIVTQTMCREMGPFMTALILAASIGSAMAAELGTMVVSEEIDALQVMSVNPVDFLVMPRLLALLIMCPTLTVYTDIIGIIGGGFIAVTQLDVNWSEFYQNAMDYLKVKDIYVGIFKAFVFGLVVATISCHQGLSTTDGALGVGKSARKAVVRSFLFVLVIGYFLTRLFY